MKSCMKLCYMIDVRSPDNVRTLNGHLKDMLCPLGEEGVYTSDDFTSNSCIEKKKRSPPYCIIALLKVCV